MISLIYVDLKDETVRISNLKINIDPLNGSHAGKRAMQTGTAGKQIMIRSTGHKLILFRLVNIWISI